MDGDAEENIHPPQQTEEDEFITVVYAPMNDLLGFLEGINY